MRPDAAPKPIHLTDYAPQTHVIAHAAFTVSLHPTQTHIRSRLFIKPNPKGSAAFELDGEDLELLSLTLNGETLPASRYTYANRKLAIRDMPRHACSLVIEQRCNPKENTALSGLYLSNGIYCTQMEAEGFRRFAFFQDRPDVMATFDVRIEAPHGEPILLSNGNPGETGPGFAEWHDPHPKPSYLFALVAGDLAHIADVFETASGRMVKLGIYVEQGKQDRCAFAMEALKLSMRWDEEKFGREYDLDVFNIVAVSDFNMGAMENKGLNIFNDKYILARPDTATDVDYELIEAIIAHEYFHNWTGNRITCRDWFQLCLKEGLTVFRDQEFTSDVRSRAVKRIQDVRKLRARQFPEDQGPLAHPVRPTSYIEINNFYTATVYDKGAELCRMMQTLIGSSAFHKAMDLYFQRHDGEAATVEDFVTCMADASGRDLKHFFRWYEQAGTPIVTAETRYDETAGTFELTVAQTTPPTPGQSGKQPLHIPLSLGLIGPDGKDAPLNLEGLGVLNQPHIELTEERRTFRFLGLASRPRLSLNRGFSAPVILRHQESEDDLVFRMAHDADSFNRWEAAQSFGRSLLVAATHAHEAGKPLPSIDAFARAIENVLHDANADNAFKALMLALPSEMEVTAAIGKNVNSDHVAAAREAVRTSMARKLLPQLHAAFDNTKEHGGYKPDPEGTGRRSLRYALLSLIATADPVRGLALATDDFDKAGSMAAEIGALSALLNTDGIEELLQRFIARHGDDHLLVDKWLSLCAMIPGKGAALRVEALTHHSLFKWSTPNKVYALLGGLGSNFAGFHAGHGEGYRVIADAIIRLNASNPQVASRLATGFRSWRLFEAGRRAEASRHMARILATPRLSPDVFEIISKTATD